MKQMNSIEEILDKIEEMRKFCKAGDEVIPFLNDLFVFLQDIMPLMTDINISLHDTSRKLPTASDKISSATSATEMATHEIMNKLDNISKTLLEVQTEDAEKIAKVQNDINDIVLALQFQDITSQQLEHADRILAAIHEKFFHLFSSIEKVRTSTGLGSGIVQVMESGKDDEQKKKEAETFEDKTEDKMRYDTEISQDDIDALFG